MPNLLLVTTEIEAPSVYLVQNREAEEVLSDFKTEALLANRRGWLYELRPSGSQHFNTSKLVTLNFVRGTDQLSAAEHYFRKALRYARINAAQDEVALLEQFTLKVVDHLKQARKLKEVHEGPAKDPEEKS